MTPYIHESRVGVFICSRQLIRKGIVLGKWFYPQKYPDGDNLLKDILGFLGSMGIDPKRAAAEPPIWIPLESNNMDSHFVRKATPDNIVVHAKACLSFGVETVRAYRALFGKWPSAGDLLKSFHIYLPDALARTERYLRRRKELGRHKNTLKSPAGREWLTEQALSILGRKYRVHMGALGDAHLFRLEKQGG